jgi:hypothetical protein
MGFLRSLFAPPCENCGAKAPDPLEFDGKRLCANCHAEAVDALARAEEREARRAAEEEARRKLMAERQFGIDPRSKR